MTQSSSEQYDYLFKIVLVGDSGVGKTQILNRWMNKEFNIDCKPTIGVDSDTKMCNLDNKLFKLQIWDTAGHARYKALISAYYRGAYGVILVFDVCNEESFSNLNQHLAEIKQLIGEGVPIFLLANKVDLEDRRKVTKEMAEAFAQNNQLEYVEFSAKTDIVMGFESKFIKQIYSKELEKPTKASTHPEGKRENVDDLKQKIENFKKLHGSNEQIKNITRILNACISKPQNERQQFVDCNLKRLQQELDSLYWTNKSLLNAAANFVITILLAVSVIGLPIAYCTGLLAKNKQETSHSLMFFRFGEYQATKAECNKAFAEMDVTCRI